jgi:2-polyprenyl-6-methoxyphenol hydroxylase-like FAD-dependent oxidoreductase
VTTLPDGPDLSGAERVSKVIGTSDYPCVKRHPVPRPGLALIGDAATSSDPVPAVGAGWAFRTAEMLAVNTTPALLARRDLRRPLRRYRNAHRLVDKYDKIGRADARAEPANPVQRAVRTAAVHDPDIALRLARFANRTDPPTILLNPRTLVRSLRIAGRQRRRRGHIAAGEAAVHAVRR